MATSESPSEQLPDPQPAERRMSQTRMRRVIDAPVRAFHWLFVLSFSGAWLTAESEPWRGVHVALGYAFGGLLLFRLAYGLVGPRYARLSSMWHRVSGVRHWLHQARAGLVDRARGAALGMAGGALSLLAVAGPLVLSGYVGYVDAWGLEDVWDAVHELLANMAMALVVIHLALIAVLSMLQRRNLATPMLTGHAPGPGPDLVKANRTWLAVLLMVVYLGFVGWQTAQSDAGTAPKPHGERHGSHRDDD